MRKIIISIIIIIIVFLMIFIISDLLKIASNKNINKYQYDDNKKVSDLNIDTIDDYIEYLTDMSKRINPQELRKLLTINESYASVYKDADATQHESGQLVIKQLVARCYKNLFEILIKKDQNWLELPLTEEFRKKFNEKDGIITEVDVKPFTIKDFSDPGIDPLPTLEYEYPLYLKDFSLDKKTFSVVYDFVSDDAYEKYSDYNVYYMIYEGAGAYNEDLYNYEFVLDKDGYLDDIVFKGITHLVVEGRNVE